jgi:thioredoxin 1
MKTPAIFLLLILATTGTLALRADLPPNWSTNYTAVLVADETNQPSALFYFTASWCGPCKLMTRTTLADPAVTGVLADVAHVAVDIDEHADLATRYGVDAVPTFILLSAAGEADRTSGYRSTGEFLSWLTNGLAQAHQDSGRLVADQQTLAAVDQWLAANDTNSSRAAAGKLFELCAERNDAIKQAAAGRLKKLALRNPATVLDGLNDARLACRIQAANALRSALGDTFDGDPWSDAIVRRQAVETWHEKLEKSPIGPPRQENQPKSTP